MGSFKSWVSRKIKIVLFLSAESCEEKKNNDECLEEKIQLSQSLIFHVPWVFVRNNAEHSLKAFCAKSLELTKNADIRVSGS